MAHGPTVSNILNVVLSFDSVTWSTWFRESISLSSSLRNRGRVRGVGGRRRVYLIFGERGLGIRCSRRQTRSLRRRPSSPHPLSRFLRGAVSSGLQRVSLDHRLSPCESALCIGAPSRLPHLHQPTASTWWWWCGEEDCQASVLVPCLSTSVRFSNRSIDGSCCFRSPQGADRGRRHGPSSRLGTLAGGKRVPKKRLAAKRLVEGRTRGNWPLSFLPKALMAMMGKRAGSSFQKNQAWMIGEKIRSVCTTSRSWSS